MGPRVRGRAFVKWGPKGFDLGNRISALNEYDITSCVHGAAPPLGISRAITTTPRVCCIINKVFLNQTLSYTRHHLLK
jgi:hypothetical protein